MSILYDESNTDLITALEILHIALSDIDIRELVLDEMDLPDEDARRILQKVNQGLQEAGCEPQG